MYSVQHREGQFQTFYKILSICMLFALGAIGEMTNFFDFGSKTRVGNSLMVFWANCLFFVSKRAKKHSLVKKSELLTSLFSKEWQSLFCKEWRSLFCKEWRVRFAFGHKKGEKLWKTVKNLQKNINFFEQIAHFLWVNERFAREKEQITHVAL